MQKPIKEAILRCLKKARPGKLLDIPCGSCWLDAELPGAAGWKYSGADLYTSPGNVNFRKADLNRELPYEEGSFDYVTCLEGLEHVENYHHVLREFHRVLKPGGMLIISTPNPLNIKSRIRYILTGTFYGFPHLVKMPAEGEHLHMTPVNLSFLVSFAARYGFGSIRSHRIDVKPKIYRFLPHWLALKSYVFVKTLFKDKKTKELHGLLSSKNILLNDNIVVSFIKETG